MIKKLSVLIIYVITLFYGCGDGNPGSDFILPGNKYPAMKGNSWDYKIYSAFLYYDSTGNFDSSVISSSVVKIVIVEDKDSIGAIKNLLRFESSPENGSFTGVTSWYRNDNSGLYLIATTGIPYNNDDFLLPKIGVNYPDDFKAFIIKNHSAPFLFNMINSFFPVDTTVFAVPIKKLQYPYAVGNKWFMRTDPLIERFVKNIEMIEVPAGTFECYVHRTSWYTYDIKYDYFINKEFGLIKSQLELDSIPITTSANPDSAVGYFKYEVKSELLRKYNK
jgi:hypothetical protein